MSTTKIAITIDESLLKKLDRLVKSRIFLNRSKAIQDAISDKLSRIDHHRLAQECSKLDKHFEQALAEEGLNSEIEESRA